jgi:hypothetical protein
MYQNGNWHSQAAVDRAGVRQGLLRQPTIPHAFPQISIGVHAAHRKTLIASHSMAFRSQHRLHLYRKPAGKRIVIEHHVSK